MAKPDKETEETEDLGPDFEQSHAEWLDNPRILLTFGDDWVPGKYQVPGTQVPTPAGFHRAQPHEVTKPVLEFANQVLKIVNPNKLPQAKIIGKRIPGVIESAPVLAQIEWHYDNHPPRPSQGFGPMEGDPFYHMGVSLYMPNVGFGYEPDMDEWLRNHGFGFGLGVIIPTEGTIPIADPFSPILGDAWCVHRREARELVYPVPHEASPATTVGQWVGVDVIRPCRASFSVRSSCEACV